MATKRTLLVEILGLPVAAPTEASSASRRASTSRSTSRRRHPAPGALCPLRPLVKLAHEFAQLGLWRRLSAASRAPRPPPEPSSRSPQSATSPGPRPPELGLPPGPGVRVHRVHVDTTSTPRRPTPQPRHQRPTPQRTCIRRESAPHASAGWRSGPASGGIWATVRACADAAQREGQRCDSQRVPSASTRRCRWPSHSLPCPSCSPRSLADARRLARNKRLCCTRHPGMALSAARPRVRAAGGAASCRSTLRCKIAT